MNTDEQKISDALHDCHERYWIDWDYTSYDSMSHWYNSDEILEKYPFLNIDYIDEVWSYPCFTASDLVEEYLELYRKNSNKVCDE